MNFTASHLIFVIFLAGQTLINNVVAQRKRQNEYQQILSKFNSWKEKQFRSGTYASEKNCNPDTMLKKGYKGPEMGIPKELTMSFFDLNNIAFSHLKCNIADRRKPNKKYFTDDELKEANQSRWRNSKRRNYSSEVRRAKYIRTGC